MTSMISSSVGGVSSDRDSDCPGSDVVRVGVVVPVGGERVVCPSVVGVAAVSVVVGSAGVVGIVIVLVLLRAVDGGASVVAGVVGGSVAVGGGSVGAVVTSSVVVVSSSTPAQAGVPIEIAPATNAAATVRAFMDGAYAQHRLTRVDQSATSTSL